MDYKVILSDFAKLQLDDILFYICMTLGNETAASRVLQDAEHTIQKLTQIGGSLKYVMNLNWHNMVIGKYTFYLTSTSCYIPLKETKFI